MTPLLATFSEGVGWFVGGAVILVSAVCVLVTAIRGRAHPSHGWRRTLPYLAGALIVVGLLLCVVGGAYAGCAPDQYECPV